VYATGRLSSGTPSNSRLTTRSSNRRKNSNVTDSAIGHPVPLSIHARYLPRTCSIASAGGAIKISTDLEDVTSNDMTRVPRER
jgi:hypothetical protein